MSEARPAPAAPLRERLRDPEAGIRLGAAAEAYLADRPPADCRGELARLLDDPSEDARTLAALALAQQTGRLTLSLVGTGDEQKVSAIEIDRNTLLGIEEQAPAPEVEAPKVCTIRTNKGGEFVETVIPCTD